MNDVHRYSHISQLRFILLLCGTLTVLLGFYATGPRLAEFATEYFSLDRQLSERGIAWLGAFRKRIFLIGVLLLALSLVADLLVRYAISLKKLFLETPLARRIDLPYMRGTAYAFSGSLVSLVCRVATNEKFVWCFLILMFLSIQIPAIFLSAHGGLHAEGIDLNVPKNLARHGIYGTLTTGGFDELSHRISAGPAILLPHALVFKLFGIDIYYSRALYVAYQIILIFVFYHLGRYLYGKRVALLSLAMFTPLTLTFVVSATDGYKGPALCYFLIGTVFWLKSIELKKNSYLVMSGLFWGLAFQAKWLFLFAVFALLVTWFILRLSNNPLPSRYWIIPCSMVLLLTGLWVGFRIANIGPRKEYFHLLSFWSEHWHRGVGGSVLQGLVIPAFFHLRPIINLSEADLWGELQPFLLIPALVYAAILIRKSKMSDYKSLFLLSFVAIWLLWWFLLNYDLQSTHLWSVRLLSQLFIAKFLYDLWNYASHEKVPSTKTITAGQRNDEPVLYPLKGLVIIVIVTAVILPLAREANNIHVKNVKFSNAFREMVTYIKTNTEKNAVFSGWDWSLPWHLDLDDAGDHLIKDRKTYPAEQREAVPEYFIVSPEWPLDPQTDEWPNVTPTGAWVLQENASRRDFLEKHASLVKTFPAGKHEWMLFKIDHTAVVHPSSESRAPSTTSSSLQQRLNSRPK